MEMEKNYSILEFFPGHEGVWTFRRFLFDSLLQSMKEGRDST